jgi:plastocyanin
MVPEMRHFRGLTFGVLVLGGALAACTDDSGNGTGNPGRGGAGGGAAGAGGGGVFTAVAPCATEASYTAGTAASSVTFGAAGDFSYTPKCLKVPAGAQVTFMGDFSAHPLEPSALRGTLTDNPIEATSSGNSASFTFPIPGYYAYFCAFHGPSDGATGMVGVIWVQ